MSQGPPLLSSLERGVPSLPVATTSLARPANSRQARVATAVVYCEANFGGLDGKTANGLVRHSERYVVRSVASRCVADRSTGCTPTPSRSWPR